MNSTVECLFPNEQKAELYIVFVISCTILTIVGVNFIGYYCLGVQAKDTNDKAERMLERISGNEDRINAFLRRVNLEQQRPNGVHLNEVRVAPVPWNSVSLAEPP